MRSVRDLPVRVKAAANDPHRRDNEGKAILAALPEPAWLIALDETGRQRTSPQLAAELGRLHAEWPHAVVFAIGSDVGLSGIVRSKARETLSLGKLTLSHELARVVIYEQIYRALAIEAGIKYHRGSL